MTGQTGWRTVDIVVASTIAVAFGVVFWAWNLVWAATALLFVAFPPLQYLIYGVWLMPAVLGALIVRKPGAALFTEVVAASASALLGSQWGLDAVVSGLLQGGAAELVFLITRYRRFGLGTALVAGAAAAVGAWVHDMAVYFPGVPLDLQLAMGAFMVVSAVLVAGLGSHLLARALARAGVLSQFPIGATRPRV